MSGPSTYEPKTGIEKWLDTRLPIIRFGADLMDFPTPKNLSLIHISEPTRPY